MYILLPYVLNKENQGFGPLLIAYICEIIPNIISFFLIDETKTKGRLGVLMLGTML